MIRSSLGLFPWCSVGCLVTVPVLAEKDEKKQIRGGTLARFYQGHGVYDVAPRLGLSEKTKEGLIRYSPIVCVEFWTVSDTAGAFDLSPGGNRRAAGTTTRSHLPRTPKGSGASPKPGLIGQVPGNRIPFNTSPGPQ